MSTPRRSSIGGGAARRHARAGDGGARRRAPSGSSTRRSRRDVACACAALNAERENVFARLSGRARASLPDPGATKLASNVAELGRLGLVAADVVGDALRRDADAATRECSATSESHLDPRDADARERRGPPSVAVSHAYVAGTSLLALSGSLPRESQPLDWAAIGVGALVSAWDDAPAINGDETTRAIPEFPQSSAIALESRRRRRAGRAVAPASKASIALAIVASLTTMPINQPLPAIRAVVNRARDGFASRPDVRVAAIARALATHAEMRTHPEAIVVMTPLGEIIGAHMEEDVRARRAAHRAETAAAEAERAASSAASAARGAGARFGASSKKKRAERDSATRALETLRAEAARATAEARAVTYREELVVCAVEAILALRPADEEARAGWRQVALEASATLRRAALWTNLDGRRAAPDAALRLIARLCAAAKVALSEGTRPDAQGTHSAAQRVLAALVQEASTASPERTTRRRRRRRRRVDRVSIHRFSNHSRGRTKCGGRAGGTARTRGGWTGGRTPSRGRGPRRGNRTRGGGAATRGNPRAGEIVRRVVQRVGGVGGWVGVRGTPRREVSAASRGSGEDAGRDALVGGRREHRESGGVSREKSSREISGGGGGRRRGRAGVDDAPDIFPPASSPPPLALAHLLAGCGTARAAGAEGDFHLASAARARRRRRRGRAASARRTRVAPLSSSRSLLRVSDGSERSVSRGGVARRAGVFSNRHGDASVSSSSGVQRAHHRRRRAANLGGTLPRRFARRRATSRTARRASSWNSAPRPRRRPRPEAARASSPRDRDTSRDTKVSAPRRRRR